MPAFSAFVRRLPQILLAVPLLLAGMAKLAGVPALHASFAQLGLPIGFGYFIGAAEVAGALGLFIAPLRAWAAAGIAVIMAGALVFHLMHTPLAQGLPALLLLGLALWILKSGRRG